jgi:hypothetical protein
MAQLLKVRGGAAPDPRRARSASRSVRSEEASLMAKHRRITITEGHDLFTPGEWTILSPREAEQFMRAMARRAAGRETAPNQSWQQLTRGREP